MKSWIYSGILTIVAIFALSGCKMGQRYQRPDLNMPQSYLKAEENELAEMKWWEVYADTTLQRLIKTALENNKDILASEARMQEMEARKHASFALLFPNVSGRAYAQNEGQNYGGYNSLNTPEHGLKLSAIWELDLWGGKRWRHEQSKAQWAETVELRRNLMISIIADVAISYYQLVALDDELELLQFTYAARQADVNMLFALNDSTATDAFACQQAQVECKHIASTIPLVERDIKIKENDLAFLLGQYPGTVTHVNVSGAYVNIADSLPDELSSKLLERRPDIRAAEQRLIAANAQVGIDYTNRFPSFSLWASGGLESDEIKTLLKSPWHFLSPSVDIPIFNLGRLNAEYLASKRAYEAQVQEYEKVVLAAFEDVSDALYTYNKSKDIYDSMVDYQEAAAKALDMAQAQYLSGAISYHDLVDIQRSTYDAQLNFIYATRDRHLALVALYKALGGGWDK